MLCFNDLSLLNDWVMILSNTFRNPLGVMTLGCTCELHAPSHLLTAMSPLHVLWSRPSSSNSSGPTERKEQRKSVKNRIRRVTVWKRKRKKCTRFNLWWCAVRRAASRIPLGGRRRVRSALGKPQRRRRTFGPWRSWFYCRACGKINVKTDRKTSEECKNKTSKRGWPRVGGTHTVPVARMVDVQTSSRACDCWRPRPNCLWRPRPNR